MAWTMTCWKTASSAWLASGRGAVDRLAHRRPLLGGSTPRVPVRQHRLVEQLDVGIGDRAGVIAHHLEDVELARRPETVGGGSRPRVW
jgi:hypothetical protein